MALVLKDRVKESSNTTGTGTFSLGGAYSGFQSFSVVGNSNTTYYAIVNLSAAEWEVGIGTYTVSGSTLSRDTILESSNSGSAVNFSAGIKDVFCTYPAEKAVTLDDVQTLSNKTIVSPSVSGAATFSGGTANGVAYLNGSKVLTTGSALTFDGANLGLGVTPDSWTGADVALDLGTSSSIAQWSSSTNLSNNMYRVSGPAFKYKNTAAASIYQQSAGSHIWYNAASGTADATISFTQAMTLDASGRLGIGASSPSATLDVVGTSGTEQFRIGNTTGGTDFGITVTENGNAVINSAEGATARGIQFQSGGTNTVLIDSSGNLLVGATSIVGTGGSTQGAELFASGAISTYRAGAPAAYFGRTSDGEVVALYSGTTQRGAISISGATTTYGSVSDYRLKENIAPITGGLSKVMALKPSTFNFIEFPNQTINGFIAHEVAEVEAIAVVGEKDAVNEEGNPLYQSVDAAKLVPLLTAAIQEQQALITQLQADVAALKA